MVTDTFPTNLAFSWQRILAFLLDNLLVIGPLFFATIHLLAVLRDPWAAAVVFALAFLYKPFCEGRFAATLGKRILQLRVVDGETKEGISFNQAFNRYLPWAVSQFATVYLYVNFWQDPTFAEVTDVMAFAAYQAEHPLSQSILLGLLIRLPYFSSAWIYFDPLRRALHDQIAGTLVVRPLPAETPPLNT